MAVTPPQVPGNPSFQAGDCSVTTARAASHVRVHAGLGRCTPSSSLRLPCRLRRSLACSALLLMGCLAELPWVSRWQVWMTPAAGSCFNLGAVSCVKPASSRVSRRPQQRLRQLEPLRPFSIPLIGLRAGRGRVPPPPQGPPGGGMPGGMGNPYGAPGGGDMDDLQKMMESMFGGGQPGGLGGQQSLFGAGGPGGGAGGFEELLKGMGGGAGQQQKPDDAFITDRIPILQKAKVVVLPAFFLYCFYRGWIGRWGLVFGIFSKSYFDMLAVPLRVLPASPVVGKSFVVAQWWVKTGVWLVSTAVRLARGESLQSLLPFPMGGQGQQGWPAAGGENPFESLFQDQPLANEPVELPPTAPTARSPPPPSSSRKSKTAPPVIDAEIVDKKKGDGGAAADNTMFLD
mmetsp:Transcript_56779/g.135254  ORF Transcript_56779/g.135254 Transcript_56779/m.135254 type:complete len:401 (+) Transcript_56779:61-1263(+)